MFGSGGGNSTVLLVAAGGLWQGCCLLLPFLLFLPLGQALTASRWLNDIRGGAEKGSRLSSPPPPPLQENNLHIENHDMLEALTMMAPQDNLSSAVLGEDGAANNNNNGVQPTHGEVALETAALDAIRSSGENSEEEPPRAIQRQQKGHRRRTKRETILRRKETLEMKNLMETGDLDGVKRILDGTLKRGFSGVGGLSRAARRHARLIDLNKKLSHHLEQHDYISAGKVQRQLRLLEASSSSSSSSSNVLLQPTSSGPPANQQSFPTTPPPLVPPQASRLLSEEEEHQSSFHAATTTTTPTTPTSASSLFPWIAATTTTHGSRSNNNNNNNNNNIEVGEEEANNQQHYNDKVVAGDPGSSSSPSIITNNYSFHHSASIASPYAAAHTFDGTRSIQPSPLRSVETIQDLIARARAHSLLLIPNTSSSASSSLSSSAAATASFPTVSLSATRAAEAPFLSQSAPSMPSSPSFNHARKEDTNTTKQDLPAAASSAAAAAASESKGGGDPRVAQFLMSAGLDRYIQRFSDHHIDYDTLSQLTEKDLAVLLPPVGHRTRLRAHIQSKTYDMLRQSTPEMAGVNAQINESSVVIGDTWQCTLCTVTNGVDPDGGNACSVCGHPRSNAYLLEGSSGKKKIKSILSAAGLSAYIPAFEKEAIEPSLIKELSPRELEALIPISGHRARFRLYARAASPPLLLPPSSPSSPPPPPLSSSSPLAGSQMARSQGRSIYRRLLSVAIKGSGGIRPDQMKELMGVREEWKLDQKDVDEVMSEMGISETDMRRKLKKGEEMGVPGPDCVVCMDRRADYVVMDCMHNILCKECADIVRDQRHPRCPNCRGRIRDIRRIFY